MTMRIEFTNNDTIPPNTKLEQIHLTQKLFRLEMNPRNDKFHLENKQTPFFLYWATPIPHNPLQAPQKWINYYKEKFWRRKPYLGQNGYFPHQNPGGLCCYDFLFG